MFMDKEFYTVKEVCEITGLNKKLLHDYDKENIVKPTAYKNHQIVTSKGTVRKGYKLYDKEAVVKLYQATIYRELNMSRKEIKEVITSPQYNSNKVLDEQIALLEKKEQEIRAAKDIAKMLRSVGNIKYDNLFNYFPAASFLSSWKENVRIYNEQKDRYIQSIENSFPVNVEDNEEINRIIKKFCDLEENDLKTTEGVAIAKEVLVVTNRELGFWFSFPLVFSAYSKLNDGNFYDEMDAEFSEAQAECILEATGALFQEASERFIEILWLHKRAIGIPLSDEKVLQLVTELKDLVDYYFGLRNEFEYEMLLSQIRCDMERPTVGLINNLICALKYYCLSERSVGE